jgi:hypothetical protein
MDQHQIQAEYRDEPVPGAPMAPMSDATLAPGPRPGGTRWNNNHFINIRLSIPLVFTRIYVTLVAGKERRCAERRRADRQEHPLRTWGNMALFGSWGALSGLALFALVIMVTVLAITHFFEIDITLR